MGKKKLIIVMGGMSRGGAERVCAHISNYFAEKGWNVYIVMLLANNVEYILHERVNIVDLSGTTDSRLMRIPHWLKGIRRLVKDIKPNCVLSFVARVNIITQLACNDIGIRVVVSERNDPYSDGRSKYVDWMTRKLYPKATSVVFQTKRAASYFEELNLKNACIIPNPVTVKCMAASPKSGKIVTVGRLAPQKNQKLLIEAFVDVKKKYPYTELHIFGEGYLREELLSHISFLGLQDSVFLKGNVSDVHEQIANAAMFVLSSDYEGLSNALLEAMMMGLPCISTDCAGSDEYIMDGQNGILTSVGDKDGLVKAMCLLISNGKEADRIGKAAKQTTSMLTAELIMPKWADVIET